MTRQTRNAEIGEKYKAGAKVLALSEAYGLSEKVIRNIVSIMGADRRAGFDAQMRAIAVAIHAGQKPKDVAAAFGVSVDWARKIAKDPARPEA